MSGSTRLVLRGMAVDTRPRVLAGSRADVAYEHVSANSPDAREAFEAGRQQGIQEGVERERMRRRAEDDAKVEQALAAAREEGRAAGLRQGLEEAAQHLEQERQRAAEVLAAAVEQHRSRVADVTESIVRERAVLVDDAEDDIVALVHAAVCRILGDAALEPNRVHAAVRTVLRDATGLDQVCVHVHPADFELLHGAELDGWIWKPDAAVQLGGAIIRSGRGYLDARLETQLRGLTQALVAARQERTARRSRPAPEQEQAA